MSEKIANTHLDRIAELEVDELTGERLLACHVRDEDGERLHVSEGLQDVGDVACSEWP